MSLKATLWALDEAPVDNPTAVLVLIGLADEARDDGTGACPYKDKLVVRARVSERSVQNHLRELYRLRLIDFGDPRVAQRRYHKRAGHAPKVWDLNLAATRSNVPDPRSDEEMESYSKKLARGVSEEGGVQNLHPTDDQGESDSPGVQPAAPQEGGGVQLATAWGEAGCTPVSAPGVQPASPFPSFPEKIPSPLPPEINSPPDPVGPQNGGDHHSDDVGTGSTTTSDLGPDVRRLLNLCVEEVRAVRPGWPVKAVTSAMREQLNAGFGPAEVVAAMRATAADPNSVFPGRVGVLLKRAAVLPAEPLEERTPMRVLDRGVSACPVHPGQPAHTCGGCAGEMLGGLEDEPSGPHLGGEEARAAIRKITAERAGQVRLAAQQRRHSSRLVGAVATGWG